MKPYGAVAKVPTRKSCLSFVKKKKREKKNKEKDLKRRRTELWTLQLCAGVKANITRDVSIISLIGKIQEYGHEGQLKLMPVGLPVS